MSSATVDGYLGPPLVVTSGVPGFPPPYVPLSTTEKESLIELMGRCADIHDPQRHYSELYVRFLRARQFNIDKAEEMFRNMVKWRKEFDIENKIRKFKNGHPQYKILSNYWPGKLVGTTRDSSLIWVERLGLVEPAELFAHVSISSVLLYHLMVLEEIEAHRRAEFEKQGWSPGFLLFQDAVSIGMKHSNPAIVEYVKTFIKTDSDNYPETMRKTFFINAPTLFSAVYALVKGFMDENTQSKIDIFSSGLNNKVLAFVAPDQLPTCVGGTSNIEFPTGGEVEPPEQRSKVIVPAGDTHQHHVEITTPGTRLHYEFYTKGYNVHFRVLHKENPTADPVVVIDTTRVESHVALYSELLHCDKEGIYIFEFDNSQSRFRSKELHYKVTPAHWEHHTEAEPAPRSSRSKKKKKKSISTTETMPLEGAMVSLTVENDV